MLINVTGLEDVVRVKMAAHLEAMGHTHIRLLASLSSLAD